MKPLSPEKILVVCPFGLGDTVFAFALVEALRAAGATVDFVANERTDALVAMNPSVRRRYVFNRDRLRGLWRSDRRGFRRELGALLGPVRRERYDAAFDLSLGREYAAVLALLGVRRRIGYDYRGRGFFLTDRVRIAGFGERRVRDWHGDLLERWRPGASAAARYPRFGRPERRNGRGPLVVVAPGGGRSWGRDAAYKQWPAERFGDAARALAERRGARVVVAGDAEERGLCEAVARRAGPGCEVLAGQPLARLAATLREADLFVGNDGGLLHLADLFGVPFVGIFGPVDERVYGPASGETPGAVLTEPVPCRPCYRDFRFPGCPYEKRCLTGIPVERVTEAAERLLSPAAVAGGGAA
jgi:ADP-heptose:LPS heptosyltransferase